MDDLIKKLKEMGVTAGELSKGTGIPTARIYKWLSDIGGPKYADAQKIEKFLQCLDVVPRHNNLNVSETDNKTIDSDTLATIKDIARSNVTLADANKVLADNNSDLIGLLKKANSAPALQDTGAFLFPYLQRIALGGVGKFWKDVGAGLEELSNILHEYPADKIKSHN